MTALLHDWHKGTPTVGVVVLVWHRQRGMVRAKWDGAEWRDLKGETLDGVEWWHA